MNGCNQRKDGGLGGDVLLGFVGSATLRFGTLLKIHGLCEKHMLHTFFMHDPTQSVGQPCKSL
jgi:hypothetical protein